MKNDSNLFEISYPHVREVLLVLAQIMSSPIRSGADNVVAKRCHRDKDVGADNNVRADNVSVKADYVNVESGGTETAALAEKSCTHVNLNSNLNLDF